MMVYNIFYGRLCMKYSVKLGEECKYNLSCRKKERSERPDQRMLEFLGRDLILSSSSFIQRSLREGTFFLGGQGRAGEFWYFFPKKVLTLPCILTKKTPDPPPLAD